MVTAETETEFIPEQGDLPETLKDVSFEYCFAPVDKFQVETVECDRTGKRIVQNVIINDEAHKPSKRFFNSLFARFQFSNAFFKYFDHTEVFERIAERGGSSPIRICIERGLDKSGDPTSRLLAVSNPAKPIVGYAELMEKIATYNGDRVTYNNGTIESFHELRSGSGRFKIGPDYHENRFVVSTPIDGYGLPSVYLAFIRHVCENGLIAMTRAFRSLISIGKGEDNIAFSLVRCFDQFANEEGYAALRQRVEAAQQSWCSVRESNDLYKLLVKLHSDSEFKSPSLRQTPGIRRHLESYNKNTGRATEAEVGGRVMTAFHGMTGDASATYGLANLDSLSVKRQATLPVNCTIYDVINFATELSTHYLQPVAARRLNSWVGELLTAEYDMEGVKANVTDFADFHTNAKLRAQLTGSKN